MMATMQESLKMPPSGTGRERMILALAVLLAVSMALYVRWVMIPIEEARYAAAGRAMDIGDLYPRWHGTRELLFHGRDPYGADISREIQKVYYGHALDLAGADKGKDEQRFAYPVYVVFYLAPTVRMDFSTVQWVLRWTLGILTVLSVPHWLRVLGWQPSWPALLTIILLTLGSPALVQALRLQQLALLVAFLLAGCAALLARGRLLWAGCLLAGATIKPQLVLLPVIWLLVWATGDWKNRQKIVWGFAGMMALLMGAGQILLPGWLGEFVRGLFAYSHYAGMSLMLEMYLPHGVARLLAGVIVGVLLVCFWRWRFDAAESSIFFVRFALVLAVGIIALPPLLPPFNQVFLLAGVLVVLRRWDVLWQRGWVMRAVCCCGIAALTWAGITAGVLAATHVLAPQVSLQAYWDWPFRMCFLLPPIVGGLLAVLARDLPKRHEANQVAQA